MSTTSSTHRLSHFDDMDLRTGTVPHPRGVDPHRVTPEQVERARRVVARNAEGDQDCQELLDMLGLMAGPDGVAPVCR